MSGGAALTLAAFVNPLLLGGLGLIGVPILIHLLSRRRYRLVEWGATRFLLEAEKENRRRVRFEQWLLLALRCIAMGLLALLVARPFVQPGLVASLLGGEGTTQRIVVLDDSASLSYRSGTHTDFDNLRAATLRLLSWLHQEGGGDPVSVFLTSQPLEPLIADTRLSDVAFDDLRARIERLAPVSMPARPRRVLAQVAEALAAAGGADSADVYILSDFQRSDGLAASESASSAFEPLRALERPPDRVFLIATEDVARENIAILELKLERPQTTAPLPAVITASIANYTNRPMAELMLQVEIDGAPLPPTPIESIEAGQRRVVSFEAAFPNTGFRVLTVGLGELDAFSADNTRRIAVPVKEALRVLLVNGQPAADPYADEVYRLRTALAPPGQVSSGIQVEVIEPSEIIGVDLQKFDCVLLCNVAPPAEAAVAALERFVRQGGGLAFFLGAEVGAPDEYNRAFYADGAGLLPLPLQTLVDKVAPPQGVGLVRTIDHPVTAIFPAPGAGLSEYVRFRAYYRCREPLAETKSDAPAVVRPAAEVLARYTGGDAAAALVERAVGLGRVLLFTSTVDLAWNDWPRALDGSYLVTSLELVYYAAQREAQAPAFLAGERLAVSLSPDRYEPGALIKSPAFPDEPPVDATPRATSGPDEPLTLDGPPAKRLGIYRAELTQRSGERESRPLCVNLDPRESALTCAGAAELDALLAGIPHEFVRASESFLGGDEKSRRELWKAVLTALFAVLLAEQTLAWWFGRALRGARRPRRAAGRVPAAGYATNRTT